MFGIERNCLGEVEVYAPLLDRSSITTGMIEEGLNEAETLLELFHVNRAPEETELNRAMLAETTKIHSCPRRNRVGAALPILMSRIVGFYEFVNRLRLESFFHANSGNNSIHPGVDLPAVRLPVLNRLLIKPTRVGSRRELVLDEVLDLNGVGENLLRFLQGNSTDVNVSEGAIVDSRVANRLESSEVLHQLGSGQGRNHADLTTHVSVAIGGTIQVANVGLFGVENP